MRSLLLLVLSIAVAAPVHARTLGAQRIAVGLSTPVYATAPPGDPRIFVLERSGTIRVVANGAVLPDAFLDLGAQVDEEGEGGLLGMAFSPSYASDGTFYVYFTTGDRNVANDLVALVARFTVSGDPATSNVANPASQHLIFSVVKPTAEHNGGTIAIRNGFLYLAIGDGGGLGDPDDLAQKQESTFGKMLRFDLSLADPLPQIWARGFRNPFRWSFDAQTGDLYIGDVGFSDREEIDVEGAATGGGRNYGWDVEEGSLCFDPTPALGEPPCGDPSLVRPVYEYAHDPDAFCNAVVGGVVYRGAAMPSLQGEYLFGDYCTKQFSTFRWDGAGGTLGPVLPLDIVPDAGLLDAIGAITQDGAGEVLLTDLGGEIFRLVPEPSTTTTSVAATATLALAALRNRSARKLRSSFPA
jgi:glucose/arabinose dehydrogenase